MRWHGVAFEECRTNFQGELDPSPAFAKAVVRKASEVRLLADSGVGEGAFGQRLDVAATSPGDRFDGHVNPFLSEMRLLATYDYYMCLSLRQKDKGRIVYE